MFLISTLLHIVELIATFLYDFNSISKLAYDNCLMYKITSDKSKSVIPTSFSWKFQYNNI